MRNDERWLHAITYQTIKLNLSSERSILSPSIKHQGYNTTKTRHATRLIYSTHMLDTYARHKNNARQQEHAINKLWTAANIFWAAFRTECLPSSCAFNLKIRVQFVEVLFVKVSFKHCIYRSMMSQYPRVGYSRELWFCWSRVSEGYGLHAKTRSEFIWYYASTEII
jgi:hypothetical protein